jgi:hypothetical protein
VIVEKGKKRRGEKMRRRGIKRRRRREEEEREGENRKFYKKKISSQKRVLAIIGSFQLMFKSNLRGMSIVMRDEKMSARAMGQFCFNFPKNVN